MCARGIEKQLQKQATEQKKRRQSDKRRNGETTEKSKPVRLALPFSFSQPLFSIQQFVHSPFTDVGPVSSIIRLTGSTRTHGGGER